MHLARSQTIVHSLGNELVTPTLVPSFSSKGFGFSKNGLSEVKKIFDVTSPFLTEIMLISAYDIANNYIPMPESAITNIIIVDSGGYEISNIHDLSTIYIQPVKKNDWSESQLKAIYDKWPTHIPGIFVSFDKETERIPFVEQIKKAKALFSNYPDQLKTILLKPERENSDLHINTIISNAKLLRDFDIIGITEKELGNSVLKRMQNIAEIRLALDDLDIKTPIHVFGSLDPITSCLYFLSGAEIFDGLTWLRFGFMNGTALYMNNYAVRNIGVDRVDDYIKAKTIQDNLNTLFNIETQMRKFLNNYNFDMFAENSELLKGCYESLKTKVKRLKKD